MASFKTHLSSGIIFGLLGAGSLMGLALTKDPGFLVASFLVMAMGALLPDMDSDSGVPFHVTFGVLSVMVGIAVFQRVLLNVKSDYVIIIGYPIAAMVFMWVIVGTLFRKFTRHRGMAHSIPAALISGSVAFFAAGKLGFNEWDSFLLAVCMFCGYAIHLLLDELYAAINFGGVPFLSKSSLGSALKFHSNDVLTNIAVYGILCFLVVGNWTRFALLFEKLVDTVKTSIV